VSRAASIAWLGWRFVAVQPLRKALRRTPGLARFGAAWFGEGLVPTPEPDRELALAASACTGCGLCEARCDLASRGAVPGAMGLQSLFRLHAKHLGELRAAAPLLAACAGCAGCEGCDDACPSGVPISRIVARLRQLAGGEGERGA
jgi:succinate dehydrogenase/fumarate reductase-like Fe-S protein